VDYITVKEAAEKWEITHAGRRCYVLKIRFPVLSVLPTPGQYQRMQ